MPDFEIGPRYADAQFSLLTILECSLNIKFNSYGKTLVFLVNVLIFIFFFRQQFENGLLNIDNGDLK